MGGIELTRPGDLMMKTCPKCGAENRQTASECRLCATPLESPVDLLEARKLSPSSLGAPFVAGARVEARAPSAPSGTGTGSGEAAAPGSPDSEDAQVGSRPSGPKTVRTCPNCGVLVPPGLIYCGNCGRTVSTEPGAKGPAVTARGPRPALADVPASPARVPATVADVPATFADAPAAPADVQAAPTDAPATLADVPAEPADVPVGVPVPKPQAQKAVI